MKINVTTDDGELLEVVENVAAYDLDNQGDRAELLGTIRSAQFMLKRRAEIDSIARAEIEEDIAARQAEEAALEADDLAAELDADDMQSRSEAENMLDQEVEYERDIRGTRDEAYDNDVQATQDAARNLIDDAVRGITGEPA